ncbi:MAG TPA: PLP-dependent aminotransferase family protein [Bryobacteraceae bacterium]|jgi:GntR family transcriptional regulator/MocR family aminotransferase|nr:PLP-dependent aminotransferase family protein [Bryobacteraceae bacterium]
MGTAAAPASKPSKTISIDRNSRIPFYQQSYDAIRLAMQDGTFPAGSALPSLTILTADLGISRKTVRRAIQKLLDEDLLHGDINTGLRVPEAKSAAVAKMASPRILEPRVKPEKPGPVVPAAPPVPSQPLPLEAPKLQAPAADLGKTDTPAVAAVIVDVTLDVPEVDKPLAATVRKPDPLPVLFSRRSVLDLIDLSRLRAPGEMRPFRPGLPDAREFPMEIWEGLRARLLRDRGADLLAIPEAFGYQSLREAIAARLRTSRGLKCSSDQVIICPGIQQALQLAINTLVSPGDMVGVEEPGIYGVKAAFLHAGAKVIPLLVDDEGVNVPDARRQNPPVLVYTTPANQFPLGASQSLPRRLTLVDYARQTNTWILEDDSDGDFCYTGRPVPSLQGLDDKKRVIYLGTTGKTVFPSLEIGYLVVPLSLLESFSKAKEIMGGSPCAIDQATLAHFLLEGHFDRHLQRMNAIYYQRLQALSQAVDSELDGYIDLEPATGGLHAVGWLARGLDETMVANSAASAGIELPVLSSYGRTALVRPGVLFGFASFAEKTIRQTVQRLGQALRAPEPNYRALLPAPLPAPGTEKQGFFRRLFRP